LLNRLRIKPHQFEHLGRHPYVDREAKGAPFTRGERVVMRSMSTRELANAFREKRRTSQSHCAHT
jgi:hypothetical protein